VVHPEIQAVRARQAEFRSVSFKGREAQVDSEPARTRTER
jgi:hypothetical protein